MVCVQVAGTREPPRTGDPRWDGRPAPALQAPGGGGARSHAGAGWAAGASRSRAGPGVPDPGGPQLQIQKPEPGRPSRPRRQPFLSGSQRWSNAGPWDPLTRQAGRKPGHEETPLERGRVRSPWSPLTAGTSLPWGGSAWTCRLEAATRGPLLLLQLLGSDLEGCTSHLRPD